MALHYLDFEYSEDEQGWGCFDAMASVRPEHRSALQAEVSAVLGWARSAFAGQQQALEDGGEWDYDLHSAPEPLAGSAPPLERRHTLTLTVSGTAAFCAALREHFAQD